MNKCSLTEMPYTWVVIIPTAYLKDLFSSVTYYDHVLTLFYLLCILYILCFIQQTELFLLFILNYFVDFHTFLLIFCFCLFRSICEWSAKRCKFYHSII
jgi:hypothetical protein